MAKTSPDIVEMPHNRGEGVMPTYTLILDWLGPEIQGLSGTQLDFDDDHPDREWMWWSIRRQVSHMAWDSLVFPYRRCAGFLWPDGERPEPIVWEDHLMGRGARWDRVLDETSFWTVPDLIAKLELGIGWLTRVVGQQPIEVLRATTTSVSGTHFWAYVIQTLPRGASPVEEPPGHIVYDLEGSLWMVFYELLAHLRTIQRLKMAQGLEVVADLPRVGYLHLPEYWGETDANGPDMSRLTV
ncbi:MAG: hypothetical protein GY724_20195 [Actinomycetia bacterium]|nr:hypothetical protein [Actinomycetes bacterium]MCP5033762.1 hypothetical protein [Actinomycetes bacterium]